jgi:phage N-6-adenine-methyltransferase
MWEGLHDRFRFTVDVAASETNAKLPRYFTIMTDGLAQDWSGERVWCNPPFSDIRPWAEKAHLSPTALVVMLVPANRTEQGWWQEFIEPHRDRGGRLSVEFLSGRLKFTLPRGTFDERGNRPPFGCCLLIWATA